MTDFYSSPTFYDTLFTNERHIGFYRDICSGFKGNILELACGTGQIIGNLKSLPNALYGTDLSSGMVQEAVKAYGADGDISFSVEDMRSFKHDRQYDVVFIARNSMLHLNTETDFERAFACIAQCLAPDGIFVFDIFVPSLTVLVKGAEPDLMFKDVVHPVYGPGDVYAATSYDPASQISHSDWWLLDADNVRQELGALDLRCIFPQELSLLLKANGFELIERYGSLQKGLFDSSSGTQACICRRISS